VGRVSSVVPPIAAAADDAPAVCVAERSVIVL
jgi:hypothetical protein